MTFVLDWTAPSCTLTGIERQIYEAEAITAYLTPSDNTELKTVRVYLDSELLFEKNAGELSDETLEIPLKSSAKWQTLQVYLCDMAGNEFWTNEMPVFVSEQTKQVPDYVKTRPSAREKMLRRLNEEPDEEQSDAEEGREAADQKTSETKENSKARAAGISSGSVSGGGSTARGKTEGAVLLGLGLLMFASTVAAYVLSGFRKKN